MAVSIVVEPGKQGHVCWIFYSLWEIKISVNKYATVISDSRPPGTQEGEKYLWSNSHQIVATPYSEPNGTQDGKKHSVAEMHMKGMISVGPDSYIFPYVDKC